MSPEPPGGRSDDDRERARQERIARRTGRPAPPPAATPAGRAATPRSAPAATPPPASSRDGSGGDDIAPRRPLRRPPIRTRVTHRGRVALAFLLVVAVAVVWFLWSLFQPFHGDGTGRVAVTVPPRSGANQIGDLLERKGVVSSSFFFSARATLAGKRGDLKPGSYVLKRGMSYGAVLDVLTAGPPVNTVTVVVPEGRSRREIAVSLRDAGLAGDYLAASKRSPLLDPARYRAKHATDLEGFLFPATYELKRGSSMRQLVTKQLQVFKQRFPTVSLRRARTKNLTPYDVLIIGSLVERETAIPSERPLIASVIYNRLHKSMPLQIDATSRFEFNKWSGALTRSELQSPSPYNTRIHRGLPPGPIGNPGLASIRAAAAPAKTSYLFYVNNPCKPDTHTFAKTLTEFNAAVARYNAARTKAGGNAPKGC
jgi:peptidoglycan lytic transglycosylase G